MNLHTFLCIILAAVYIPQSLAEKSANILVFIGGGSYSHKLGLYPLLTALADRGHNVTVLSGFKKQPSKHPKVHELFSHAIFNRTQQLYPPDRIQERIEGKNSWVFDSYNTNGVGTCKTIMEAQGDPVLDYVINEGKFDLVIDNTIYGECGIIIAHQKKAKLILYVACSFFPWYHDEFGFPDESAAVPDMSFEFSYPMTLWQRLRNLFGNLRWFVTRRMFMYPQLEAIMQKRYNLKSSEVPAFADIQRNADLVVIYSHYSNDFARSLPPFIVSIGGMQCFLPTKPLTEEYKTLMDNAPNGVVLVAFGSTINLATLPPKIKSSFMEMMRQFPEILFIWRWDGPEPEDKPENLFISKWLPQFQILAHPNLKAFISHAGLNSLSEATYHGVPVILIPLFSDQDYNGYRIEATEIGIRLEMRNLNSKILISAVDQVLSNPKYSTNMKSMSALFRDRPMNPIETGVYWTEFVLRHNSTKSLKPIQNLTFFQRRLFDVALIFIFVVSFLLALLFAILFRFFKTTLQTKALKRMDVLEKKKKCQ